MNKNSTQTKGEAPQSPSSSASGYQFFTHWRNCASSWVRKQGRWLVGLGLLAAASFGLLVGSFGFVWLLALLTPGEFESLAEHFIERVPALMIATPLALLLALCAITLLICSSLGLVILHALAKRFKVPQKLLHLWTKVQQNTKEVQSETRDPLANKNHPPTTPSEV